MTVSLPITEPVLIFALAMLVFLVAPLIFERFRVPGIVGLILIGAVIGPNAANLLARDATIVLLGTVGLLYLMFVAGIEIDLHGFKRYRNRSIIFGSATYLLPQVIGTLVFLLLFDFGWAAAILIASMFASHTLVAYPIATRLGISKNESVTTAVGGTIITDTVALLVLAVVAASVVGDLDATFWATLSISLAIYVAAVFLLIPRLGRWFFRNQAFGQVAEYIFVLAVLFATAWLAEVAGIEAIVGAFFAGLALNRLIPESGPLSNRIHFFGNAFFIPFFLISVGMLVDVRVLIESPEAWAVMIGMTVTVTATKLLAAKVTQRLVGYSSAEGWTMFGLSVPQAAATLAATLIGFEIGLFGDAVLNGSILMILVTCIVGPWVVEKYGRKVAMEEERKPYRPSEAPQRILIPMANPATAGNLMDLAMTIRHEGSEEPLYPLIVVPEAGEGSAARVADAEKALGHSVLYASGAEVPVHPLTRVDRNFANGIQRAIKETRTSTIVVGWDGRKSRHKRTFGTVLDQLLVDTRQLMLVAKLAHPLNTTRRIVLIIPEGSDRHPGFHGAARTIKEMAYRLGAVIDATTVGVPSDIYQEYLTAVKPEVEMRYRQVPGWREMETALSTGLRREDLVVVLGAREGRLSWSPELSELPGKLAELVPESFVMIYPSLVPETAGSEDLAAALPERLDAKRLVLDLPALEYGAALDRLLRSEIGDDEVRAETVRALVGTASVDTDLLAEGVVVTHARVDAVDDATIFIGLSPDGIRLPGGEADAHVMVAILSPTEEAEAHQQLVARVSELFGEDARASRLRVGATAEEVFSWFRADDQGMPPETGTTMRPQKPRPTSDG